MCVLAVITGPSFSIGTIMSQTVQWKGQCKLLTVLIHHTFWVDVTSYGYGPGQS